MAVPTNCSAACFAQGPAGFSFTSPGSATNLAGVKLGLSGADSGSGTVTVALYSSTSGPAPNALIATLGAISESSVSSGNAIYDFPVASGPALTPNTRYWIVISDSSTSSPVLLNGESPPAGTGVSGEYLGGLLFSQYQVISSNSQFNEAFIGSVTVDPGVAVTPAPPSVVAVLIGLAFLGLYMASRRFERA